MTKEETILWAKKNIDDDFYRGMFIFVLEYIFYFYRPEDDDEPLSLDNPAKFYGWLINKWLEVDWSRYCVRAVLSAIDSIFGFNGNIYQFLSTNGYGSEKETYTFAQWAVVQMGLKPEDVPPSLRWYKATDRNYWVTGCTNIDTSRLVERFKIAKVSQKLELIANG